MNFVNFVLKFFEWQQGACELPHKPPAPSPRKVQTRTPMQQFRTGGDTKTAQAQIFEVQRELAGNTITLFKLFQFHCNSK